MDCFDDFRPRFSPVNDSISYRYSVGFYTGNKRCVLAWFCYEQDAIDFWVRCFSDHPHIKFDYLRSLF